MAKRSAKYCSRDHFYKSLHTKTSHLCENLGCVNRTTNARFCTSRCSAIVTNSEVPRRVRGQSRRDRPMHPCERCRELTTRPRFCSDLCGARFWGDICAYLWATGQFHPTAVREWARRYLETVYGRKCRACGRKRWMGKPVPLHVDHINGNHDDNRFENVRFLCSNCHELTPTWGFKKRQVVA